MAIHPLFDNNSSQDYKTFSAFLILFAVILTVFIAITIVIWRFSVNNAKLKSEKTPILVSQSSDLIHFSEQNIEISKKWNLLSGRNPTVSFSMTTDRNIDKPNRIVFLYKYSGSDYWNSIDVHSREPHHYSLTIRDLESDINYDCLFMANLKDTVLLSKIVSFKIE